MQPQRARAADVSSAQAACGAARGQQVASLPPQPACMIGNPGRNYRLTMPSPPNLKVAAAATGNQTALASVFRTGGVSREPHQSEVCHHMAEHASVSFNSWPFSTNDTGGREREREHYPLSIIQ